MPTLSLKMHNFERWRRTAPFSSTRTTGDHGNLLATNVNPRKLIVQHPLFNLQQPLVNRSWTRFISDWLLPASQWPVYSPEISTTDKNIFMREHCKEWWLKIRGNYFVTIKKQEWLRVWQFVLTVVSLGGCQRRLPCWWEWEGSASGDYGNEEGWYLPDQERNKTLVSIAKEAKGVKETKV